MNPGWYPDPWTPGLVRWWDGTAWSAHTAPVLMPADPRIDLSNEQRAARRASIAVLFIPVVNVLDVLLLVVVLGDFVDRVHRWDAIGRYGAPPNAVYSPLFNLGGLALIAVQIFVMIWLHRAATLARRAGLPSQRDPVWAVLGFLIPIVNFWFPYQVAVGCFPPGDPRRKVAGYWWTWYLIGTFALVPVAVAAFFSRPVAVCFGVVAVGAAAMTTLWARRLIAAIGAAHEKLLLSPGRIG